MLKKLLVPLDWSSLAEQAIGRAASIARASGGEIDLVLVREPLPFNGFSDVPWTNDDWRHAQDYLDAIVDELETGAGVAATSVVMHGLAEERIPTRAREVNADLIVMTSHGRTGLSRAWLGSVADSLVRHATTPVLMLRAAETRTERTKAARPFAHVLVPHDGSAFAADVLPLATDLARANKARMTILRVAPPVPLMPSVEAPFPFVVAPLVPDEVATREMADRMRLELGDVANRIADGARIDVRAEVVINGQAATAIVDYARAHDVDVVAMSTHGRGASRWLLGSVVDKVLRASDVPVLLRRPTGVREDQLLTDRIVTEELPALVER